MAQYSPQRRRLIIVLLALIALIGMLSGALTRTLLMSGASTTTLGGGTTNGRTTSVRPATTPTATQTPLSEASTSPASSHFTLVVAVAPSSVVAGSNITITVHATIADTQTPLAGLTCQLRTPTDGATPLLTHWPAAVATDSNGIATWTTTAPQTAGRYEVEAFAQTPSWTYIARTGVTVRQS